jgi:DNA-binding XRE family transcriptional regulator
VKKTKLTTFDEHKKRALKDAAFRRALAEGDDDPFLEAAYGLIALRRELGLTQTQLAHKIPGTSQQSLARLESPSYRGHSLRSLDKIARACGRKLKISFVKA